MSLVRKILVAVDFSENSKKTLAYAFDFFKGCGVEFHVVHVVHDLLPEGFYIPHHSVDEIEKGSLDYAAEELKKFIPHRLTRSENVHPVIVEGIPYAGIIDYAKKNKLELIVIGSYGMSRLEKMLLGSVTDKVIRKSPIPILVVKN